jgi:hypothetical protein
MIEVEVYSTTTAMISNGYDTVFIERDEIEDLRDKLSEVMNQLPI